MSVTKLRTIGSWYHAQDADPSERTMRGRVITGMLTGPAAAADRGDSAGSLAVALATKYRKMLASLSVEDGSAPAGRRRKFW